METTSKPYGAKNPSLSALDVTEVLSEQGLCCKNTRNDLLQKSRYVGLVLSAIVSVDVWMRMYYDVFVCLFSWPGK